MGAVLLLFILIFGGSLTRMEQRRSAPMIKYDKRDYRSYRTTAIIFAVLCVVSIGCYTIIVMVDPHGTYVDLAALVLWFLMGSGFLVSVLMGIGLFKSRFYLKRLERYGYEPPERKRDYGKKVENLPRKAKQQEESVGGSRESIVLAILALIALGITAMGSFVIFWHYLTVDRELAMEGFILLLFPQICWGICSFVFWRQRSCQKYRDDVETCDKRKLRAQLEDGLVEMAIFAGLTAVYFAIVCGGLSMILRVRS